MGRTYARDNIGRFASTGGSGGGKVSKKDTSRVGLETKKGKTRVVRDSEFAAIKTRGGSRRGNTVRGMKFSEIYTPGKY